MLFKDQAASLIAFYGQPVSLSIPLDGRVVVAALLLSLVAALVIGLLSTWQILRRQAAEGLSTDEAKPAAAVQRSARSWWRRSRSRWPC